MFKNKLKSKFTKHKRWTVLLSLGVFASAMDGGVFGRVCFAQDIGTEYPRQPQSELNTFINKVQNTLCQRNRITNLDSPECNAYSRQAEVIGTYLYNSPNVRQQYSNNPTFQAAFLETTERARFNFESPSNPNNQRTLSIATNNGIQAIRAEARERARFARLTPAQRAAELRRAQALLGVVPTEPTTTASPTAPRPTVRALQRAPGTTGARPTTVSQQRRPRRALQPLTADDLTGQYQPGSNAPAITRRNINNPPDLGGDMLGRARPIPNIGSGGEPLERPIVNRERPEEGTQSAE